MGVSHVVEPARLTDRRADCGFPETGAEAGATQRPTGRCSEDQAIVARAGRNVLCKDVDEPDRDGDGASGCAGLGLSEGEVSDEPGPVHALDRHSADSGPSRTLLRLSLTPTRQQPSNHRWTITAPSRGQHAPTSGLFSDGGVVVIWSSCVRESCYLLVVSMYWIRRLRARPSLSLGTTGSASPIPMAVSREASIPLAVK